MILVSFWMIQDENPPLTPQQPSLTNVELNVLACEKSFYKIWGHDITLLSIYVFVFPIWMYQWISIQHQSEWPLDRHTGYISKHIEQDHAMQRSTTQSEWNTQRRLIAGHYPTFSLLQIANKKKICLCKSKIEKLISFSRWCQLQLQRIEKVPSRRQLSVYSICDGVCVMWFSKAHVSNQRNFYKRRREGNARAINRKHTWKRKLQSINHMYKSVSSWESNLNFYYITLLHIYTVYCMHKAQHRERKYTIWKWKCKIERKIINFYRK